MEEEKTFEQSIDDLLGKEERGEPLTPAEENLILLWCAIGSMGLTEQVLEWFGQIWSLDRTIIDDYEISTSHTPDGLFQTGIRKLNHQWIVVEEYNNEDDAKLGHQKWVDYVNNERPTQLWSIQSDDAVNL